MPKVSKVGKFRKTAAAAAAAASHVTADAKNDKHAHGGGSMETDEKRPRGRGVERSKSFTQIMKRSSSTGRSVVASNISGKETTSTTSTADGSSSSKTNAKNDATSAASNNDNDTTIAAPSATKNDKETALSRGQKRRQAKRDQYLKRERMILSSLKLKKVDEQKRRIDGLDALREALLETVKDTEGNNTQQQQPPAQATIACTTNKAKRKLVASELHHMSLVLQHPEFQKNPFQALQEHLRNTLLPQGEALVAEGQSKRKEEAEAKQQRKEARKERMRDMKGGRKKKQRTKFKPTRSRKSR